MRQSVVNPTVLHRIRHVAPYRTLRRTMLHCIIRTITRNSKNTRPTRVTVTLRLLRRTVDRNFEGCHCYYSRHDLALARQCLKAVVRMCLYARVSRLIRVVSTSDPPCLFATGFDRRSRSRTYFRQPRYVRGDTRGTKYTDISRARTRAKPILSVSCPDVAYSRAIGDDNRATRNALRSHDDPR